MEPSFTRSECDPEDGAFTLSECDPEDGAFLHSYECEPEDGDVTLGENTVVLHGYQTGQQGQAVLGKVKIGKLDGITGLTKKKHTEEVGPPESWETDTWILTSNRTMLSRIAGSSELGRPVVFLPGKAEEAMGTKAGLPPMLAECSHMLQRPTEVSAVVPTPPDESMRASWCKQTLCSSEATQEHQEAGNNDTL
ncbi:hypothetical protein ACRRTK_020396 [Alexandromys fortis]